MTDIIKIKRVLEGFRKGYHQRDLESLDEYMENLFVNSDDLIILGTGDGELCLGYEESKELIESDWKYWGPVELDVDSTEIYLKGDVAWFVADGTVTYTFKDDDEKYKSYLDGFKEDLNCTKKLARERLTLVNWIMVHAFFDREGQTREYDHPLKLTGVLTKEEGQWKFIKMQFAIPQPSYPDVRYLSEAIYREDYQKTLNKMASYQNNKPGGELKEVMVRFEKDFGTLDHNNLENFVETCFSQQQPYIIGPDNTYYSGEKELKENLARLSDHFNDISLNLDQMITLHQGEVAWLTVYGLNRKVIEEDKLFPKEIDKLNGIIEQEELTYKERLFQLQRCLSRALMEAAQGDSYNWPFRLEAVLVKEEEDWKFHNLQFSYSFMWILEGKY